jgi:hypothetical protein
MVTCEATPDANDFAARLGGEIERSGTNINGKSMEGQRLV